MTEVISVKFKEGGKAYYFDPVGFKVKEGSKVKDDTKITLFVSMGQSTEKVPDVRNQLESYAVSQLKAAGFVTKIVEEANDEVEAGYVIRTEPQHTTVVADGETITIVVSTGKPQEFVLVPDVLGQPEEQAKKELQKVGLKAKVETQKVNITPEKDYQPAGNVLAQSPQSSSEKVAEGTEVVLYISSGLYETDIEISLPSEYEKDICTVSIWYDGKMVKESEKIDLTKVSKYTFKGITSSEKLALFQIKIKPEGENSTSQEYQDIKVDFRELSKKNAVTVVVDSTSDLD